MKQFTQEYYDGVYFSKSNGKSSFVGEYSWDKEKEGMNRTAIKVVNSTNIERVLDVGCARGFLVKAFLEIDIDAYGCDISNYAIKNCEEEVVCRLKQCDVRDGLPYGDNEFDLIVTENMFEHVEQEFVPFVLKEIARVAPRLYLSVPVTHKVVNSPWGDTTHVNYMPPSYWIAEAWNAGFSIDLPRSSLTQKIIKGVRYMNSVLFFYRGDLP